MACGIYICIVSSLSKNNLLIARPIFHSEYLLSNVPVLALISCWSLDELCKYNYLQTCNYILPQKSELIAKHGLIYLNTGLLVIADRVPYMCRGGGMVGIVC